MQPQPQQMWPPQPWGSGPPVTPPAARRRRVASIAAAVLAAAAAGVGGYALGVHHRPADASVSAEADALNPDAAKAKVCGVLKDGYPVVAAAVAEDNGLKNAPWSDPRLLAAVNDFVGAATALADRLDAALSPSTPPELRTATADYVAGLRALSRSKGNHAPDSQINGVAEYYNSARRPPLRLCGLPE